MFKNNNSSDFDNESTAKKRKDGLEICLNEKTSKLEHGDTRPNQEDEAEFDTPNLNMKNVKTCANKSIHYIPYQGDAVCRDTKNEEKTKYGFTEEVQLNNNVNFVLQEEQELQN